MPLPPARFPRLRGLGATRLEVCEGGKAGHDRGFAVRGAPLFPIARHEFRAEPALSWGLTGRQLVTRWQIVLAGFSVGTKSRARQHSCSRACGRGHALGLGRQWVEHLSDHLWWDGVRDEGHLSTVVVRLEASTAEVIPMRLSGQSQFSSVDL